MDERIEQLKIDILRNKPFFGYVVPRLTISKMSPLYEKLIGTACIDARGNIEYSEAWFKTLTDEQIIGVLCHELLHYVLHHFTRSEGFNTQVANIAQDLVINDILYNLESMRFMRMSNTIDFNNTKTPKRAYLVLFFLFSIEFLPCLREIDQVQIHLQISPQIRR